MFKTNDIVRNKHVEHLVAKIKKVRKTKYILTNGYHHEKDDNCLKLWTPKDGELVIIQENNKNGIQFIIKQFNRLTDNQSVIEPLITYDLNNIFKTFKA